MNTAAFPTTSTLAPRTLADLLPTARSAQWVRTVALVAGFAVITAITAQIQFRLSFTPVPISGTTFGVLLSGTALGWGRGAASQLLYWVAGIFMPFAWYADDTTGSSISAGWKAATGATFGYFVGFVIAAALVGYLAQRGQDRDISTSVPAMLAGTAVIYVCGVAWLAHNLSIPVANGDMNAIELGLTPFVIGDALKLLAAGLLAPAAWRAAERFGR